jgi:hypothetical protein
MLQEAFERLLEELRPLEFNRFETRAFIYLDIISWLESKIQKRPVQDIIAAKYKHRKERKH